MEQISPFMVCVMVATVVVSLSEISSISITMTHITMKADLTWEQTGSRAQPHQSIGPSASLHQTTGQSGNLNADPVTQHWEPLLQTKPLLVVMLPDLLLVMQIMLVSVKVHSLRVNLIESFGLTA